MWDGKTLAADRQGTNNGYACQLVKIRLTRIGEVVAWTGDPALGQRMADWYERGKRQRDWPPRQNTNDWARLIVAHLDCRCEYFEQEPCGIPVVDGYTAWGNGRDYALGALAMGADARRAVEITNLLCTDCGFGVDAYSPFPTLQLKLNSRVSP